MKKHNELFTKDLRKLILLLTSNTRVSYKLQKRLNKLCSKKSCVSSPKILKLNNQTNNEFSKLHKYYNALQKVYKYKECTITSA